MTISGKFTTIINGAYVEYEFSSGDELISVNHEEFINVCGANRHMHHDGQPEIDSIAWLIREYDHGDASREDVETAVARYVREEAECYLDDPDLGTDAQQRIAKLLGERE